MSQFSPILLSKPAIFHLLNENALRKNGNNLILLFCRRDTDARIEAILADQIFTQWSSWIIGFSLTEIQYLPLPHMCKGSLIFSRELSRLRTIGITRLFRNLRGG